MNESLREILNFFGTLLKKIIAFWRRHWHCLLGTFGGHRETDYFIDGRRAWIGCECGRTFWGKAPSDALFSTETTEREEV